MLAACSEQNSEQGAEQGAPAQAQADPAAADAAAWLARELGWVEGADPAAWAARDRAQNNYRFLSVCAMGCSIVGVGETTVHMCYRDVPVDMADKTTEAVQSEAHAALKVKARAFAEDYNRLMLAALRETGRGTCPPDADWDAAYAQMTQAVDDAYPGQGFRGDVTVDYRRAAFQVRLPRGVAAADVRADLCGILARNGLAARAAIEAKSVDKMEDYAALACR